MAVEINTIKVLAKQIGFPPPLSGRGREGWVQYPADEGGINEGRFVHSRRGQFSIVQWHMRDTCFVRHIHEELEVVVVYEGRLPFRLLSGENDQTGTVAIASLLQPVVIPAGVWHDAFAEGDVWLVAISVPESKDYPGP